MHGQMVQGGKVSTIMDKGIAHSEGSSAYIASDMHPVGIVASSLRCSNVDMNVRAVRMIDEPAIYNILTLMRRDGRMWMNAEVQSAEVVYAIPKTLLHRC